MSKNKFGFGPVEDATPPATRRAREPGPMSVAVRETAGKLADETEAKLETRRQNASDAKAFRAAHADGLILTRLPLESILTDALPRDRMDLDAVAASEEMAELKTSISQRGQKEPIEVFEDGHERYQLKKGWRRLTALRQLLAETGDESFATVLARVAGREDNQIARYVDMVEENVVREDLTFAEMAQVVLTAAADPTVEESDPDAILGRLYGALHKMKRSYIRAFVLLLSELGEAWSFPKAVSRNLGAEVSRAIKSGAVEAAELRGLLAACRTAEEELAAFARVLEGAGATQKPAATSTRNNAQKFEFRVGPTKVTAREGECRIVTDLDFSRLDREAFEAAVVQFEAALRAAAKG